MSFIVSESQYYVGKKARKQNLDKAKKALYELKNKYEIKYNNSYVGDEKTCGYYLYNYDDTYYELLDEIEKVKKYIKTLEQECILDKFIDYRDKMSQRVVEIRKTQGINWCNPHVLTMKKYGLPLSFTPLKI